jgi:ABC-type lipoprotein release transport system permease subunit
MNTYFIPRNTKGESKILLIFSTKALIYSVVGIIIGFLIGFIVTFFKTNLIVFIISLIFGVIGFIIGTFKIPDSNGLEITRKAGGQGIDEIIIRYIKFKLKKDKLYVNNRGVTKDE